MREETTFLYKGEDLTVRQIVDLLDFNLDARQYTAVASKVRRWAKKHGAEKALEVAMRDGMPSSEKRAHTHIKNPELEPYDEDMEWKSRIEYWKKQGASNEEIIRKFS